MFTLPPLPYAFDALSPAIDEQGVRRHYLDNHAGYTKKLNQLAPRGASLADILAKTPLNTPLYNNAAQYWTHDMWWRCMAPAGEGGGGRPSGAAREVVDALGGLAAFKAAWVEQGGALFGSGWVWLTLDRAGTPRIEALPNALLPQRVSDTFPVLVSDLWEHAYYCQYGTKRRDYLARFFDVVCWPYMNARINLWRNRVA